VKLKDNKEAKAASEKYKKLRERNKHDHYNTPGVKLAFCTCIA
jgi:hypothetical protein